MRRIGLRVHWAALVGFTAPTVLVVDDDASIRFLCRVNLELDGCVVYEASSLDAARAALAGIDFDVVLLDVHVGNRDGKELLEELRLEHPDVAVALLTGSVDTPATAGCDADAVLSKPFALDELTETVRTLASRAAQTAR